MAEFKPTRTAYGETLKKLGDTDPNVIVCDADLTQATMTKFFAAAHPDQFYNFGIAEANMMCASAGLAHCGYTVFASTFAVFGAGRAFEQVRNTICYTKANVKLGLSHAGLSVGEDGGSHQAIEDIALMRSLPNMIVLVPCDACEMEKAVYAAAKINGPVSLRTCRLATEIVTTPETPFEVGKAVVLREGKDAAIIACGIEVPEALHAAETLAAEGIQVRIVDMHTIKPLDEEAIRAAAKDCGAIVTAEEHTIYGGLGSAVAEVLADNSHVPFERIGIKDRFGQSGAPKLLAAEYGLDAAAIADAVRRVVARKA